MLHHEDMASRIVTVLPVQASGAAATAGRKYEASYSQQLYALSQRLTLNMVRRTACTACTACAALHSCTVLLF